MSHATCLVIMQEEDSLDEIMAPYDENSDDPRYVKFIDRTASLKQSAKEQNKSLRQVAEEWSYIEKAPGTNKWGYIGNPNGYWDWWTVGGRWNGYLKLKDTIKYGNMVIPPYALSGPPDEANPYPYPYPGCNSCILEDFDYEGQKAALGVEHLFFSVIKNGKWYSGGLMGWFGYADIRGPRWDEKEAKLIASASKKSKAVLVDFHI